MDELLNHAPCGFLIFNDDGKIVEINQTLLDLLGCRQDALVGRHIENLFTPPGRIFYQTHFFPLLKLHDKVEEIYLSLRSPADAAEIPVLINAVRRTRGGAVFNDCVLVAIERRNRFEDELLKAKKEAEAATLAKDQFLSVVSHELRTPLNAILGWTQILQKKEPSGETLKVAIDAIHRSAAAQKVLVEDILDFARIASGKLNMTIRRVELAKVIESAVEIVAPTAAARGIELETRLGAAGFVDADASRLQQVLWNILSNAIKFTPAGGSVRVRLARVDSTMEIVVADTGEGISADFLPHVFERFRQVDNSTTKRHSGLGLGLAISRYIVESHGGTIRAASPGMGQGATFTINLPAVD